MPGIGSLTCPHIFCDASTPSEREGKGVTTFPCVLLSVLTRLTPLIAILSNADRILPDLQGNELKPLRFPEMPQDIHQVLRNTWS